MGIEQKVEYMIQDFVQAYNFPQRRFDYQGQMRMLPQWKKLYQNQPEKRITQLIENWAINCSRKPITRNLFEISRTQTEELKKYLLENLAKTPQLETA